MIFWLIIMVVIFALLAWKRLDWALMVILVLLPAYLLRFKVGGLPTTWLEVMIVIAFAVWLIKNWRATWQNAKTNWRRGKIIRRYPFDWEIVLLLAVSLLAVGISGWSWTALGLWRAYFLEPLILFLLVLNVFGPKREWGKIIWPLIVSAVLISGVGWYQKFVDINFLNPVWSRQTTPRVTSVFEYSNAVGLFLGPLVMLLVGWFAWQNRWRGRRQIKAAAILLVVAAAVATIYFARSEGALVGLAAGLVVFGLLAGLRSAAVTVVLLFCLGVSVFSFAPVKNYLVEKITLRDLAGEIRRQQWRETGQMLKADNQWLWGAGLAGYQVAVKPWHQTGIFFNKDNDPDFLIKVRTSDAYRRSHWQPLEIYLYPHNIFLNFWSELGLAGLLLFIWLIGKYFWLGFKNLFGGGQERFIVLGLIGAMTVIVVHGLVDVPYFKNDLAILFWLFFAMMGLINIWHKKFPS